MSLSPTNWESAWLTCTLSGLRAIEDSDPEAAALFWRDASAETNSLPEDDPRRAAARHNLGLGELFTGHRQSAIAALAEAREQWRAVEAWIATVDIPAMAGSSMFHFLLAANHPNVLAKLHRQKYLTLCAGAAATTNVVYDFAREDMDADRNRMHIQAIRAAFGDATAQSQTSALQDLTRPATADATRIGHREERWRSASRTTAAEMRPLVDAAYLTLGVHPEYFQQPQAQLCGMNNDRTPE